MHFTYRQGWENHPVLPQYMSTQDTAMTWEENFRGRSYEALPYTFWIVPYNPLNFLLV